MCKHIHVAVLKVCIEIMRINYSLTHDWHRYIIGLFIFYRIYIQHSTVENTLHATTILRYKLLKTNNRLL